MEREGYRANGGDRCFFCKAELIDVLTPLAAARGIGTVATGTNADDAVAGFRPGIRAADERGAVAPLRDAGLTKAQVREASRRWGLPTWDKPAAACLSSRVAYGVEVTPHRLARVERAEAAVRRLLAAHGAGEPAGPRPRRPGLGRGRPRRCCRSPPELSAERRRGRARGRLRRGRRRPEGVPLRLDERAAGVTLTAERGAGRGRGLGLGARRGPDGRTPRSYLPDRLPAALRRPDRGPALAQRRGRPTS